MWFMNHLYNPIVRWILQSPLHKLMSAGVLLITFRGKKSGKEYTTPVQYVQSGESLWIMVGFPEKKTWWRNLIGGGAVRVCLCGSWQEGQAVVFQGTDNAAEVKTGIARFSEKYPAMKEHYNQIAENTEKLKAAVFVKITLN